MGKFQLLHDLFHRGGKRCRHHQVAAFFERPVHPGVTQRRQQAVDEVIVEVGNVKHHPGHRRIVQGSRKCGGGLVHQVIHLHLEHVGNHQTPGFPHVGHLGAHQQLAQHLARLHGPVVELVFDMTPTVAGAVGVGGGDGKVRKGHRKGVST